MCMDMCMAVCIRIHMPIINIDLSISMWCITRSHSCAHIMTTSMNKHHNRFDIATDLLDQAMQRDDVPMPLLALAVWLRYSSARFLCWNKNYNVKPREISAAQDRLTQKLTQVGSGVCTGQVIVD